MLHDMQSTETNTQPTAYHQHDNDETDDDDDDDDDDDGDNDDDDDKHLPHAHTCDQCMNTWTLTTLNIRERLTTAI